MTDEFADEFQDNYAGTAPGIEGEPDNMVEPESAEPGSVVDTSLYDAMVAVDPEGAKTLRDEWADEFDMNVRLAQSTARTFADQDMVDMLEENGLGNDPRLVRVAARIGRLLGRQISTPDDGQNEPDRETLETTLDELSASPDYWTERVQRRVRQINLTLHGGKQIPVHRATGDAGGRNSGDASPSR